MRVLWETNLVDLRSESTIKLYPAVWISAGENLVFVDPTYGSLTSVDLVIFSIWLPIQNSDEHRENYYELTW